MRKRLDDVLIRQGLARNARAAFVIVTEGRVFVNGQKTVSPSQLISNSDVVEVRPEREFVGRGAYKLDAALEAFGVEVAGKVCADIGAATGGFTEVLLKHGAAKVYAIDVGRGKLDLKLREDPRVVVMEETNVMALGSAGAFFDRLAPPSDGASLSARRASPGKPGHQAGSPGAGLKRHPAGPAHGERKVDVVTIDVSFTPLRLVLPKIRAWLSERGSVVALFKPQYEIKDKSLLKHGIVEEPAVREQALANFRAWLREHNWQELGMIESPIRGSEGNMEYLFHLRPV